MEIRYQHFSDIYSHANLALWSIHFHLSNIVNTIDFLLLRNWKTHSKMSSLKPGMAKVQ